MRRAAFVMTKTVLVENLQASAQAICVYIYVCVYILTALQGELFWY